MHPYAYRGVRTPTGLRSQRSCDGGGAAAGAGEEDEAGGGAGGRLRPTSAAGRRRDESGKWQLLDKTTAAGDAGEFVWPPAFTGEQP